MAHNKSIQRTAVAPLAASDPVRYAALAAMTALLVGAIALLARIARLGSAKSSRPRLFR